MSVTSYTFYTYSQATADDQAHWLHGHTTVQFFDSLEAARQEIVKLHEDLSQDLDLTWRPLYLEKSRPGPSQRPAAIFAQSQHGSAYRAAHDC